jgi:TolB-like protein
MRESSNAEGMRRLARRSSWFLAGLVGVAIHTGRARAEAQPGRPAVSVASLKIAPILAPQKSDIEKSIVDGLTDAGFDVQDLRTSRERLSGRKDTTCRAETCLHDVAALTGTRYLVQGEVKGSSRAYSVDMRLFDSTDGRQVSAETVDWEATDPVAPPAVYVKDIARELGRKAHEDIQKAAAPTSLVVAAPPSPTGAALPPPPDPSGSGARSTEPGNPPDRPSNVRRVAPWAGLALAGLAVGGGGLILRGLDGKGTCDLAAPERRCPMTYRTNSIGISMLAIGATAVVTGIVVGTVILVRRPSGGTIALGLSPSAISLTGDF